jgi:hypothetical protein
MDSSEGSCRIYIARDGGRGEKHLRGYIHAPVLGRDGNFISADTRMFELPNSWFPEIKRRECREAVIVLKETK